MPTKSRKFTQKKETTPRPPRPKKVDPTFDHPLIERELEESKVIYERLLNAIKDTDWIRRSSRYSPSVKELMFEAADYLSKTLPQALDNAKKGKRPARLPRQIRTTLNFISLKMRARSHNRDSLQRKYLQAHDNALKSLRKLSRHEMTNHVYILEVLTTIEEGFRYHHRQLKQHEVQVRRLISRKYSS